VYTDFWDTLYLIFLIHTSGRKLKNKTKKIVAPNINFVKNWMVKSGVEKLDGMVDNKTQITVFNFRKHFYSQLYCKKKKQIGKNVYSQIHCKKQLEKNFLQPNLL